MPRIGETRCPNPECSCTDVAVNETAGGNLSGTCHKCGMPWFAKKGTKWRRDLEGKLLRRDPSDDPAPAPAAAAAPAPVHQAAPAPAPARRAVGTLL